MNAATLLTLKSLSTACATVQRGLASRFGLTKLWVGGGSAPALLDHVLYGKTLRMRDLDLVLVADSEVDRELAVAVGRALDGEALRFLPRHVWPRVRTLGGEDYLAGYGLLWDADGLEVDLSMFHDRRALNLNGLLNVDRILIPVSPEISLEELLAQTAARDPEGELGDGRIEDPLGGYRSWREGVPVVADWLKVRSQPIEYAIRIVRACVGKLGHRRLMPEMKIPLRSCVRVDDCGNRHLDMRNLLKLLGDEQAGLEMELLWEVGVFERWLPELGALVAALPRGRLDEIFGAADADGPDRIRHRLTALLDCLPARAREAFLTEVARPEPTMAEAVWDELGQRTMAA